MKAVGENRGSVAVLLTVVVLLLGLLGSALVKITAVNLERVTQRNDGICAQNLAEAGINRAFVEMNKDIAWKGSEELFGDGKYAVAVQSAGLAGGKYAVVSTGTVRRAQRKVVLRMSPSPFAYALFSGENLSIQAQVSGSAGSGGSIMAAGLVSGDKDENLRPAAIPRMPFAFSGVKAFSSSADGLPAVLADGVHALCGHYCVSGDFVFSAGELVTGGADTAVIYVNGSATLSGKLAGNITVVAAGSVTIDGCDSANGNLSVYAGRDILVERPLQGNVLLWSQTGVTTGTDAAIDKGVIISGGKAVLASPLRGCIVAGGELTQGKSAEIVYDKAVVCDLGFSLSLVANSWNDS